MGMRRKCNIRLIMSKTIRLTKKIILHKARILFYFSKYVIQKCFIISNTFRAVNTYIFASTIHISVTIQKTINLLKLHGVLLMFANGFVRTDQRTDA
jgi:hypothetical protein